MSSRSRIYIGNISSRIHERDLDDMFYKAGRIHSIEIKKGGFGFIEFTNPDDAHEAVRRYNGRELDGKVIRVETSIGHTRSRPLSSSGFAFEVTGVVSTGREMSWRDLKDWARDIAEVTYTKVLTPTVGYIEVASRRDLDAALAKLDNTTFMGSAVRVKSVDCLFRPTIDPETRERVRDDGRGDDRRGGRDRRGGNDRRDDRRRGNSPPRRRDDRGRRSQSPRGRRSPVRDSSRDRNYRGDSNRSPPRSPVASASPRPTDRDDYQIESQNVPFGGNVDTTAPPALPVYDADDALRGDAPPADM